MRWPIQSHKISCPFGWRIHPVTGKRQYHNGLDIPSPVGSPVIAPFDGVVSFTESATGGIQLILRHDGGLRAGFAHLSEYAKGISSGARVKEGDIIAYTGNTGRTTGPHLHFTIAVESGSGRKFYDPRAIQWDVKLT